jgi:hypothetical protein
MAKITRFSNDGTQKEEEVATALLPNLEFFEDAFDRMEKENYNMIIVEFDEKCKCIFTVKKNGRFS